MKLSNEKMLIDIQKLRELSQKQLPVKASYAIAKNISKIVNELEVYEKEREKLIDKYAKKDRESNIVADKNGQIQFKDKENWEKDIKELLNIEVDVDVHKFKIDELEGYDMTPAELMLIEYMIEE